MTATATRTFDSITDFLNNAEPGDTFAQQAGKRSISTLRFISRLSEDESQNATRGQGGEVESLTTEHLGKSEIAGRLEYAYRTTITTNENYADNGFVTFVVGYGLNTAGRNGVYDTHPAKRMSAKALRERHRTAVLALFGDDADLSNV